MCRFFFRVMRISVASIAKVSLPYTIFFLAMPTSNSCLFGCLVLLLVFLWGFTVLLFVGVFGVERGRGYTCQCIYFYL